MAIGIQGQDVEMLRGMKFLNVPPKLYFHNSFSLHVFIELLNYIFCAFNSPTLICKCCFRPVSTQTGIKFIWNHEMPRTLLVHTQVIPVILVDEMFPQRCVGVYKPSLIDTSPLALLHLLHHNSQHATRH